MGKTEVRVDVPVERAFSIFVEQMETWWPVDDRLGEFPLQTIFVEPRVGGRWYERDARGHECEWGKVVSWEPPNHVAMSWRSGGKIEITMSGQASSSIVEVEYTGVEPPAGKPGWVLHAGSVPLQVTPPVGDPNRWERILAAFAKVPK